MRAEELARAFKAHWWRLGSGWNPSLDEADIAALIRDAQKDLREALHDLLAAAIYLHDCGEVLCNHRGEAVSKAQVALAAVSP